MSTCVCSCHVVLAWELRQSGLLRRELWQFLTDVSGQNIGPIFRNSWPLKMGPRGCPETSVGNCHYSLRNSPEERSWRRNVVSSRIRTWQQSLCPSPQSTKPYSCTRCAAHDNVTGPLSHRSRCLSVLSFCTHKSVPRKLFSSVAFSKRALIRQSIWHTADTQFSIKRRHIKRTGPNHTPCSVSKSCDWFCLYLITSRTVRSSNSSSCCTHTWAWTSSAQCLLCALAHKPAVPRTLWKLLRFRTAFTTSGVSGRCSTPPPPEIPRVLQNRAKLNPIVKTVKNCWV